MQNSLIKNEFLSGLFLSMLSRHKGGVVSADETQAVQRAVGALMAADDRGDVCASLGALFPEQDDLTLFLESLKTTGLATFDIKFDTHHDIRPFVIDRAGARLYWHRYFCEEMLLAKKLLLLSRTNCPLSASSHSALVLNRLFPNVALEQDYQKNAVQLALTNQLTIISGGPGTGKTTTVVAILECLLSDNPTMTVALAAPTGKAASRMLEAIRQTVARQPQLYPKLLSRQDISATTIHKLLFGKAYEHRPSQRNPLKVDLLVVDEASMIDIHLAQRLFSVIGDTTKVIALGDKYQLAAVGPGAVFADISDNTPALASIGVQLIKSHRFSDDKGIGALAASIREGSIARTLAVLDDEDIGEVFWDDAPANQTGLSRRAQKLISEGYRPYVDALNDWQAAYEREDLKALSSAEKQMWRALSSFRAIAAQRQGAGGVECINAFVTKEIRRALNVEEDTGPFLGQLIIVRENDDVLELSNGDIGVVLKTIGGADECPRYMAAFEANDEKNARQFSLSLLPFYETAFALTVHQSQGSEFKSVVVFLPSTSEALATRELLYTGITRAKERVAIVGSKEMLCRAVSTKTERLSGLKDRIEELFINES